MKHTIFFITALALVFSISPICFSKEKTLSETNPSVQLLKTLTLEGHELRKNDIPVEKADTEKDTHRVKEIKRQHYEKYDIKVN